jgi:hypothetical protein
MDKHEEAMKLNKMFCEDDNDEINTGVSLGARRDRSEPARTNTEVSGLSPHSEVVYGLPKDYRGWL